MADFDPNAYLAEKTAEAPTPTDVPHGTPAAPAPFNPEDYLKEKGLANPKYETPGQMALTAVEGGARGASLGLSDVAETKLGLAEPEDIKARKEANPLTSGASQIAGAGALIYGTGGLAIPAEAVVGTAGLGAAALAGAGEGALMGAGNVVSDAALGDPNLSAQKIMSEVGMSALFGGLIGTGGHYVGKVFTGAGGYPKGTATEALEDTADTLKGQAKRAAAEAKMPDLMVSAGEKIGAPVLNPKVTQGAKDIGAPLHEGMQIDGEWAKKLTDALINTDPTFEGQRVGAIYNEGWDVATKKMDQLAGEGALSKRQLGDALQNNFSNQIEQESAPFNQLYGSIKEVTKDIPLSERSAPAISKNILDIPEVKRSFNSPAAKLAGDVAEEIQTLKSVDDLRAYQTELNGRLSPMAPPQEKRILGLVQEKLDNWERSTIQRHATNFINKIDMANPEEAGIWGSKVEELRGLMGNIDAADKAYAPFRKDLGELSEWLGKGKVYGPKDAINFIKERLEPEDLVNKLSTTKYSKLFEFIERKFPEQGALIKQYIKNSLRENSLLDGKFSPKKFIGRVEDLEPEIQKALFNKEELDTIKATKDYLSGFPKNYNPSGTANKSALLALAESPRKMAVANARAMYINRQIKVMASLPGDLKPNPIAMGMQIGQKLLKINAAETMAERTTSKIATGAEAIFNRNTIRGAAEGAAAKLVGSYEDRAQRVAELAHDPEILGAHLSSQTFGMDQHLPNISQSIQNAMTATIQFLNSKLPRPPAQFPMSSPWKPSDSQKQKFDKYYEGAMNPLKILDQLKKGTLTSEMLESVSSTHPDLFNEMRTQVLHNMTPEASKKLTYSVKQSLAKFLGKPLDSSMLPQVILSNQKAISMPSPSGPSNKQQRSSQAGLAKLDMASRAETDTQDLDTGGEKKS